MNWKRYVSAGAMAIGLLLTVDHARPAAARTLRIPVSSLGCTQVGQGLYFAVAQKVAVARIERFAQAYMGKVYEPGLHKDELVEMACSVPTFSDRIISSQLTMTFGFADDSPYADDRSAVRLVFYRDGQPIQAETVTRGELRTFTVDLTNTRTFTIDQFCVRTSEIQDYCPNLYMFDDTLQVVLPDPPPPVRQPPPLPPAPPAPEPPRTIRRPTW